MTTVEKIEKYLNKYNFQTYKVKYIHNNLEDYENIVPPIKGNGINLQVYAALKNKFYSYEEEIRMIIFEKKIKDKCILNKRVKIDPDKVIDKIIVSPFASEWYYKLIKK